MTAVLTEQWRPCARPAFAAPLHAVDAYRWVVPGEHLVARVAIDTADLAGHFPGFPIYPGVFVVESLVQAVAQATGSPVRVADLDSLRFLAPLLGGDELTLEIGLHPTPHGWRVRVAGRRRDGVAAARVTATLTTDMGLVGGGSRESATEGDAAGGCRMAPDEVRALLPQRHPLLLVDRVVELAPGRSIVATKSVTAGEPCYARVPATAAPWAYAYPSSLMLESLGQAAALLWLADAGHVTGDEVLMFVGARGYRVRGAATAGDVLRHEVELVAAKAGTVFVSGRTRVGAREVAAIDSMIAAVRPRSVVLKPPGPSTQRTHPTSTPDEEEPVR